MNQLEKYRPASQEFKEDKNLSETSAERINDQYSIIKKKALKYIVNCKGEIVSKGYHDFKVYSKEYESNEGDSCVLTLIGKTGAEERLLKIPENIDDFLEESSASFHEIDFDEELGLMICKTGAVKHIFDMNTGEKIGNGYHEIFKRDGKLYGGVGDHGYEEEIKMPVYKSLPPSNS